MLRQLSGGPEPTEYHGLPVPQVREAKDARPSGSQLSAGWNTMRACIYLLMALSLVACETDDVEYFCPETDFSERNSLKDTMFIGTWQWAYTVFTCNQAISHGGSVEIIRDTVWANEYVSWLDSTYPERTIIISEDLSVLRDNDNQEYCITEWRSSSNSIDISGGVWFRQLNEDQTSYMSLTNRIFMGDALITVRPLIHDHDVCPSVYPGYYYPGVQDHYIKVN
jgi:hypothetical protein